jgi:uncharacterized protein YjiS (DUF1127 family)
MPQEFSTFDASSKAIGSVRTMYRMINEKAAASVAHETGFAALSRFGNVLANSVRRHFKRTAIERELSRLDNRMLADLGLGRSDIGAVAQQAVAVPGEGTLFQEFSRLIVNLIVRPLVEWNRRREIYDQLMSMDDRMLADIGMTRYDAAEYVRRLGRELQEPLPEALAAMEQDITAPLRAWNRARLTERQLNELSDRQLMDIGVVRGDIAELAQEVARKAVANFNAEPETPKAA